MIYSETRQFVARQFVVFEKFGQKMFFHFFLGYFADSLQFFK